MKKSVMVMGLAVALMLLLVPAVALADNGPHGGYTGTNTPDGCAACHRAHTAQGEMLLKSDNEYALCTSCHGTANTGADTNVLDGVYTGQESGAAEGIVAGGLRAGGFQNTLMNTNYSPTAPASHNVLSGHKVEGQTGNVTGTVWGYGAISPTVIDQGFAGATLECTSCHNPHGNAGPDGAASYRLLRSDPIIYGSPSPAPTAKAWVEDTTAKTYTIAGSSEGVPNNYFYEGMDSSGANSYYQTRGTVPDPDSTASPVARMTLSQQVSYFCVQCHTRYSAKSGAYAVDSGDSLFHFRHASRTSGVNCVTCHVSHGSSADSTALANSASLQGDGAMLRLDNRGVCANCHAAEWVYGVVSGTTAWSGSASDTTTVYTITGTRLANKNAAGTVLAGGRVRLVLGTSTVYGVVSTWSETQVQFTVPSGLTAGTYNVSIIPNGCRDSAARLPRWPNANFSGPRSTWTQGWGTLTLN